MKTLGFSCTQFTLSSGYCSARAAQPLYGSQQREPRVQFRSCLALTVLNFSQQIVFSPLLIFQKAAAGLSLCISARGREPPCVTEYFLWALLAVGTGCLASSQLSVLATLVQATSYRLCGHGLTTNSISCPYCSCSQQVFARFVPVLMEWLFSRSAVDLEVLQPLLPYPA